MPTLVQGGSSLRVPMSYEQYLAIGETKHHEYYDELCVVNPPSKRHVLVARRLTRLLEDACPSGYEILPEWGWHVAEGQDYEPDVMVALADAPGPDLLRIPPLLVVEVTSPSTRRDDWGHKLAAYAAGGAQWYWIAEPEPRALTVLQRQAGRFTPVQRLTEAGGIEQPFPISLDPSVIFA